MKIISLLYRYGLSIIRVCIINLIIFIGIYTITVNCAVAQWGQPVMMSSKSAQSNNNIVNGTGTFLINFTDTHQTIDGFGGADYFSSDWRPVADQLFCVNGTDPGCTGTSGIGLTYLRQGIEGTASGNLPYAQTAVARGATIWATSWITPGNVTPGTSSTYSNYATALTSYVSAMNSSSITTYGISAQNEPDCACNGGSGWNASDTATLQATLGTALHNVGVKLLSPEVSDPANFNSYRSAIAGNSTANGLVDIWTTHQYGSSILNATPDNTRRTWETEYSSAATPIDTSIADALLQITKVHDALTYFNVTAWHYWWVSNNPASVGGSPNAFLINTADNSLPKRYFALGNYSRFVRPGWVRIGVTGTQAGIYGVSAFKKASTGDFAIIVVNNSGADIPNVTFGITNTPRSGSLTPYVTSGTAAGVFGTDGNLSTGSTSSSISTSITVTDNSFTATVPRGFITFVGKISGGGAGITPDFGPIYTGSIPAPAAAAGFTHLVMNADFSDTAHFPNVAAFVNPCGGPTTSPTWELGLWGAFPNGPHLANSSFCNTLDIEFDASIGKNVLHTHYDHTRAAVGADQNSAISILTFPMLPLTGDTGTWFPAQQYAEITFKQAALGLTQPSIPSNAAVDLQNFWFNGSSTQQYESDCCETGVNSATTTSWGVGSDGPWMSADMRQYHTLSQVFTSDGTTPYNCGFVDGVVSPYNNSGPPPGCGIPFRWSTANQLAFHDRVFILWWGTDTSHWDNGTITNDEDTYIQSIRIWTCPGGWASNNSCFGPLITHWPFP